ncbi:MAG: hypothetical protein EOO81_11635, partial [Oxalobacteraceae bacterium]
MAEVLSQVLAIDQQRREVGRLQIQREAAAKAMAAARNLSVSQRRSGSHLEVFRTIPVWLRVIVWGILDVLRTHKATTAIAATTVVAAAVVRQATDSITIII